ncbi:MAG: hypothetical protein ABIF71_13130 [Planctomycetota bacterium]
MKCDEVLSSVDTLLQDPRDAEAFQELERHFKECVKCRTEHGEAINTAAKLSEVGQISDFIDLSDDFVRRTRDEVQKESDRYKIGNYKTAKHRKERWADIGIIALLVGTVIAAVVAFWLVAKVL